jgi:Fe-S cluster assembly ATP-binding protein
MLEIRNLHASIDGTPILRGIDLKVESGQVAAIMGPNGSGKSTLAKVLAGHPDYEVTDGQVLFDGKDLLALEPEDRAREGVFLGFQYPVELPGVSNTYFLRTALNAQRQHRGEPELDAYEFLKRVKASMALLEMDASFRNRTVNVGFSGGEKKRNEVLQLLMLNPRLAVLDEMDSGLDIDALRIVAKGVNSLRDADHSFLVVTHYQRLLDYIEPDVIHVLVDGRIVRSGDKTLARELEDTGYAELQRASA